MGPGMEYQEPDLSASLGAYGTKRNFIMRLTENGCEGVAASQHLLKRVLWNMSPARCSEGIKKGTRIIKLGKDTLKPSWRFMIYTFVQQAP